MHMLQLGDAGWYLARALEVGRLRASDFSVLGVWLLGSRVLGSSLKVMNQLGKKMNNLGMRL